MDTRHSQTKFMHPLNIFHLPFDHTFPFPTTYQMAPNLPLTNVTATMSLPETPPSATASNDRAAPSEPSFEEGQIESSSDDEFFFSPSLFDLDTAANDAFLLDQYTDLFSQFAAPEVPNAPGPNVLSLYDRYVPSSARVTAPPAAQRLPYPSSLQYEGTPQNSLPSVTSAVDDLPWGETKSSDIPMRQFEVRRPQKPVIDPHSMLSPDGADKCTSQLLRSSFPYPDPCSLLFPSALPYSGSSSSTPLVHLPTPTYSCYPRSTAPHGDRPPLMASTAWWADTSYLSQPALDSANLRP